MNIKAIALVLCVTLELAGSDARSDIYLVGAQFYSCSADGTNGGPGTYGSQYQYSTNSSTSHEPLSVNGVSSAIVFPLAPGDNVFSFDTGGLSPGAYGCMNLFFDDGPLSYDPPYAPAQPIPGDLTVAAPVAGIGFTIPAAGTNVQSFNSTGNTVIATSSAGHTRHAVSPGVEYRVTAFAIDAQIDGTFTIYLPEPEASAMGGVALLLLAGEARRRSRRPA